VKSESGSESAEPEEAAAVAEALCSAELAAAAVSVATEAAVAVASTDTAVSVAVDERSVAMEKLLDPVDSGTWMVVVVPLLTRTCWAHWNCRFTFPRRSFVLFRV
jgi:hypothetical protein